MKAEDKIQNIAPFLWFENQAEEAANYYVSLFSDSQVRESTRYDEESSKASGRPKDSVMTVAFDLEGQPFVGLNGGAVFSFNPSISFFVTLDDKDKIQRIWNSLVEGGEVLMPLDQYPFCEKYGWLKDRFGVNWQFFYGQAEQKIAPCLLFAGSRQGQAEDAIEHYSKIFHPSKIIRKERYREGDEGPTGQIIHSAFTLSGFEWKAMDSGIPLSHEFNPAISFVVPCDSQSDIDHYWSLLSEGGDPSAQQCGWLKDKFGLSWQIVPKELPKILSNSDKEKAQRTMKALMQMKKLNIEELKNA